MIGVNLWGVVHGIHSFLPILRERARRPHREHRVDRRAGQRGRLHRAVAAAKVAVVSISETLVQELAIDELPIGVSVLCPSSVTPR